MLAVTVEYLHGTVRAASREDITLAGGAARGEWPPSPARLYAAFVAADGTGARCRATAGAEGLAWLEAPPRLRVDPVVAVSPLQERFVVVDATDQGSVQDYPGRKAQAVRPGVRLSMRTPRVVYEWPDADPTRSELASLQARARRIGYLGCADSPVRVGVHTTAVDAPDVMEVWQPDPTGDTPVSVAYPGLLGVLDDAFEAWARGEPRRRAWLAPHLVAYRTPATRAARAEHAPATVWVRFGRPVNGRRVLAVTEALRAAVLERVERRVGGRDAVPGVLHGHAPAGARGFEHVRWLALPNAGFPHADGRIHGACVWLPPGTDPAVVELTRAAVAGVRRLVRAGIFDVSVELFDGTRAPWASNPARWVGPAVRWVSVFPVVHERFTKQHLTSGELSRWFGYAGLPAPVSFRSATVPLVPGAVSLPAGEVFRSGQARRPYSHLEVRFAEPVTGPIAVGRGRHFGLGLLAPVGGGRD